MTSISTACLNVPSRHNISTEISSYVEPENGDDTQLVEFWLRHIFSDERVDSNMKHILLSLIRETGITCTISSEGSGEDISCTWDI